MAIKVIFTGDDGKKVISEHDSSSCVVDGMSREQVEKGWKGIIESNLESLLMACKDPHPYVPD
jgi:hypothetical protein